MLPTIVSCLVGLGWNGVPVDETNRIPVLLEGLGDVPLLSSNKERALALCSNVLATSLLCAAEWWNLIQTLILVVG